MEQICNKCRKVISHDEIAITKKLINRGTDRFFCTTCLAKAFDVSETDITKKIKEFKQMGCVLFKTEQ